MDHQAEFRNRASLPHVDDMLHDDDSTSSDDEEGDRNRSSMLNATSDSLEPASKRRKSTTSYVTPKTLHRWKATGSVNVDDFLGFGPNSSITDTIRAEEILTNTGLLLCLVCNAQIFANKKSVKRHQTKNRKHVERAALIHHTQGGKLSLFPAVANGDITLPMLHASSASNSNNVITSPLRADDSGNKTAASAFQGPVVNEAWEILKTSFRVQENEELSRLLQQLGVFEAQDLVYCNQSEIEQMARTLKKIPQRRFCQLLGIGYCTYTAPTITIPSGAPAVGNSSAENKE